MLATSTAATGTSVTLSPLACERGADHRALVLAEQPLDPLERDRIDVPGVAGNVGDLIDAAVVRRVEAVVHARGQPQGHVAAVAVGLDQVAVAQQILQRVGKALGLIEARAGNRAAGADDGVARADQDLRPRHRSAARPSLSSRVKQSCRLRNCVFLASLKSRSENSRHSADRSVAHQGLLDLAEPADEPSREPPRNAVGQQEVDVLLLEYTQICERIVMSL